MTSPLVYALTVNWNRPQDTLACLNSLACQTYPNLKILAVDNGSQDGSAQIIRDEFPQAEVLANPKNLGFAGGYNTGMRRALDSAADYIFILNNDAVLDPAGIEELINHASPDLGILAPVIYYASSTDKIWSSGGKTNRWNLEKQDRWADRLDPGGWPEVIEQDFVNGCCMLFPRQALERVGLFDENYQMYYEDSDLCQRMRAAGRRILVIPGAKAWHKIAASSGGTSSPNERYWMARSSIRFFRRYAHGVQKPVIVFWRTGSAIRTTLRLLRQEQRASIWAYWRGLRDGLLDDRKL